jgi:hypothetical protein
MFKLIKMCIYVCFFCLVQNFAFAQTTPPEYYALVKKADSFYNIHYYNNSALTYSAAFKSLGWKGYPDDRYNAACSWAKAGMPDSAFFNLERIASKSDYANSARLVKDHDLMPLHNDRRWKPLLELVSENKEKSERNFNKPLLHLLDSLVAEDQKWRSYWRRHNNGEISRDEDTLSKEENTLSNVEIMKRMKLSDSLDYFCVYDIFIQYGFPGYDIAGTEGSNNFWVLAQHQDKHVGFQDSVLAKMKIAVDAKKASAGNYAYLVDRVKINSGELQVYGTQMTLNADSTSYSPKPIIAPEKVNDRRRSVGLGTIESYIAVMNKRYYGTLKK